MSANAWSQGAGQETDGGETGPAFWIHYNRLYALLGANRSYFANGRLLVAGHQQSESQLFIKLF